MSKNPFLSIELKDLHFHAFHGLYEEERKAGNEFMVNVEAFFQHPDPGIIETIDQTVDYVRIYQLVEAEMNMTRELLETLAMSICNRIISEFSKIYEVRVSVTKLRVPVEGMSGKVSVTCHKKI